MRDENFSETAPTGEGAADNPFLKWTGNVSDSLDDAAPDFDDVAATAREDDAATTADDDVLPLRCLGTWDDVKDKPLSFGVGSGKFSSVERFDTRWGDTFRFLGEEPAICRHGRKKDGMAVIAPCTMADYAVPEAYKDESGKWHRPKNLKQDRVNAITMGMVDVDGGQTVVDATRALDELGIAFCVYASPSYTRALPKFRIVYAMDPFAVKPGDLEDRAVYEETYERVMMALGIPEYDPTCTDLNQYFYTPHFRLPKESGFFVIDGPLSAEETARGQALLKAACESGDFVMYWKPGGLLNFNEVADKVRVDRKTRGVDANAIRARGYKRKNGPNGAYYSYVDSSTLKTDNLKRFVFEFGRTFKISEAAIHYEGTDPALWHGRDDVIGKAWIRCPNDQGEVTGRKHTADFFSGNRTAFFVQDAVDGFNFTIFCSTRGCKDHFAKPDNPGQQERLRWLDLLCQRWGVADATELIDFCDLPDEGE